MARRSRPPRATSASSASSASSATNGAGVRVRLHAHGLDLGGGKPIVPLLCGAMHYWRHSPSEWGACLDAMRSTGFRLVDTYVPWGVHERGEGEARHFDFGQRDPRLDLARFLRMAHERELYVILRPGPHINAELTLFGLPERIVWDRACQARTPRQNPVMLPMVPLAFPVPSYASDVFHDETARWFAAVGEQTADLVYPDGPIVLLQVDNEGALYFRDGPYDQDYHPDAIALFRLFMKQKYGSESELRSAWREPSAAFETVEPPTRFDAKTADDLARHMDWVEFHESLLVTAMERMKRALMAAGFDGIPTTHNFPLGEAATPLNAARVTSVVDLVGLDYYHRANPHEHAIVMRRTTELAARCEGRSTPAFGAEVGAGFPPFMPVMDENDSLYTLMAALAYGLRGYSAYMAVERDRWIGAPIDPHGRARPLAARYAALHRAIESTGFHSLRRRTPVRLVVPRSLRRLARASHAFGPVTPALFNVLGAGFRESVVEDDFGLGEVPTVVAESYLRSFERALLARGVPFAYVGGETFDVSTQSAKWIICGMAGGLKSDFFGSLRAAQQRGVKVTIGPKVPDRDGAMRILAGGHDASGLEIEPLDDATHADALVARRIEELALPTFTVDEADTHVCVHEDDDGKARVVFVLNPSANDLNVRAAVPGIGAIADAMSGETIKRASGAFEVAMPARSVRMFAVSG